MFNDKWGFRLGAGVVRVKFPLCKALNEKKKKTYNESTIRPYWKFTWMQCFAELHYERSPLKAALSFKLKCKAGVDTSHPAHQELKETFSHIQKNIYIRDTIHNHVFVGPLIGEQYGTVFTFKGFSEPDSQDHTHSHFWGSCRKGTLSDFPGHH